MAWNWGDKKAQKYIQRKPVPIADGENSKEVKELADRYIRQGCTRQKAYAKARARLNEEYRSKDAKIYSAGSCSKK